MKRKRTPSRGESGSGASRRRFLAGLGAAGFAGLGIASGRTSATTGTGTDGSSQGDRPFPGPDELEAFVDEEMRRRLGTATPGASVAIVADDSPVLVKGYGTADTGTEVPVRASETMFRAGSVGKLVTFTAVMGSVERGLLDLDEDVNAYLDDSPVEVPDTYTEPVTLRHLGTHTAGFESALDPEVVADPDAITSLEAVLADQPSRVRPPGELVGYSNYGAALAGHVVAEVHGTTFEEYVQSEIFEPLGMAHSTFAQPVPDDLPGTLAEGHARDGTAFTTADEVFINMRPAGSLSTTASDMAAFVSAHLGDGAVGNERILKPETTKTMHERHHVRHPAVTNWRYGFHEYGDPDGSLVGHSGATINFTSHLVLEPEHGVGIFVNYNTNSHEAPAAVVDEILDEYDLRPSPPSPTPTPRSGSSERAETVAGEYSVTYLPRSGPLQVVDLLERVSVRPAGDGRLRTETVDGDARRWVETDPYVYREVDGRDVLAFEVAEGDVKAMNASSQPTGVYRPVPFHERQLVAGSVLGSALSGFGLSLAGWGTIGAWRYWKNRDTERENPTEDSQ